MTDSYIWDYLYAKIQNPYGVAALMGNLYVESKLKANNLQGSYEKKFGLTDEEYTELVDNGSYSKDTFVHDGAGYGLAQWTYWSRKDRLYTYMKKHGYSIGDLQGQVEYLWGELQCYRTVVDAMKNGTDIRTISDIIVKRYEKPADQTEEKLQNRAIFGKKYYDLYAGTYTQKVVANVKVNVRTGNGKDYPKVFLMNAGESRPYVATADNGWRAIKCDNRVLWVSSEFTKVVE